MAKVTKPKKVKRVKSQMSLESDRRSPQKTQARKHGQSDYDFILATDYEAMEKDEESVYRSAEEIINRA